MRWLTVKQNATIKEIYLDIASASQQEKSHAC
jgi:hypothetical protein